MGLFGGLKGKNPLEKEFNTYEAVSGVLLSVVASDGDVSDEEVDAFILAANRHPIFVRQTAHDFRLMIDEQFSILKKHGWQALIRKAASHVPANLKGTVFALAVDFVLADGEVAQEEEELIDMLGKLMGVDDEDAGAIVRVLALKNGL